MMFCGDLGLGCKALSEYCFFGRPYVKMRMLRKNDPVKFESMQLKKLLSNTSHLRQLEKMHKSSVISGRS